VRVPKLALDERQRDPLVQELDSVGMAELVFAPTSAQASLSRPVRYADLDREARAYRALAAFGST
jgi:hypothetical protein